MVVNKALGFVYSDFDGLSALRLDRMLDLVKKCLIFTIFEKSAHFDQASEAHNERLPQSS